MFSRLRVPAALFAGVALALSLRCAWAGTTGGIAGRVLDSTSGTPQAGVKVTVSSPSESASVISDVNGNYRFLSLAPDTYVLSAVEQGYDAAVQNGVTVLADQNQTLTLRVVKTLAVIGRTSARSSSDLIRPGTTSDVYSVNTAGQQAASSLGGSNNLNQAYSAMAAVPGVNIPSGQQGWYQAVSIRGGDTDQVGYELDGIPVNRVYDNAPQTMLSNLGQQELQVYTGGTPASFDSSGIAGSVNQVMKTGTYPAFKTLTLGVGSPTFYHKASFEYGGATSNRNLTYYVGFLGSNQDYRYGDQYNSAGNPLLFYPLSIPSKNGFVYDGSGTPAFGPGNLYGIAHTFDRETVGNVHVGIPHHGDAGKDDVQFLFVNGEVGASYYSSVNDYGGASAFTNTLGTPTYTDGTVYTGPLFAPVTAGATQPYFFPSEPHLAAGAQLPANGRDANDNGVNILKFQYQKNFTSSFLRFYAYSLYSNWFITGPLSAYLPYGAELADYEIGSHTYGGNLSYTAQLGAKNVFTATTSLTTSKIQRYTTTGGFPGSSTNPASNAGSISNWLDPSGNCYDPNTGSHISCFMLNTTGDVVRGSMANPAPAITAPAGSPGLVNGARWIATENGYSANINRVKPTFSTGSLTDQFRPTDRLTINAGVKLENYSFALPNTQDGYPARAFWFAAYNREHCFGPGLSSPVTRAIDPATGIAAACPTGTTPVKVVNAPGGSLSATIWQPRVGATYELTPNTVVRASYGVYARPPDTSYLNYNTAQQNLASYIGNQFTSYGFNSPNHDVRPDVSYNADFSLEQRIPRTDLSLKISPFYRSTRDQIQAFDINALTGLFSGLNVGRQRSYGVEAALKKGDFARDGFSAQLTYTFTRSRIRYTDFANGSNVIDNLNAYIQQYNSYTRSCATSNAAVCGSGNAGNAVATYLNNGVAIANPYYNSAAQPILDRNAEYTTYDVLPGPFTGAIGYETPNVASLILNYKRHKFTLTPTMTYSSGSSYGSPLVWPGYIPQGCTAALSGTAANPQTCTGSGPNGLPFLFMPDPYTGRFDSLGSLREPARFSLNVQLGYAITTRVRATLTLTGLLDKCYQRGYARENGTPCSYAQLPSNILAPAGNFVSNPPIQLAYPYGVYNNNNNTGFVGVKTPFQAALEVEFKL